ncbi:MAG: hypothetical protein MH204_10360 [Fimbriimonadaceae bacterium]|nr:hypothetical protein [Fimbriimonadaceae bacterium]
MTELSEFLFYCAAYPFQRRYKDGGAVLISVNATVLAGGRVPGMARVGRSDNRGGRLIQVADVARVSRTLFGFAPSEASIRRELNLILREGRGELRGKDYVFIGYDPPHEIVLDRFSFSRTQAGEITVRFRETMPNDDGVRETVADHTMVFARRSGRHILIRYSAQKRRAHQASS